MIHLAFDKLLDGEDADQIELVFVVPDGKAGIKPHCAEDLARQQDLPEDDCQLYKHVYIFARQILEDYVSHRITMSTLLRRGFCLKHLCGPATLEEFPRMLDFQTLIRNHWRGLCPFDKGYKAGMAACLFGFHSLTGNLLDEMLNLVFGFREAIGLVQEGTEHALDTFGPYIGDGLEAYESDLENLSEAAAMADYDYALEVEEIMGSSRQQPGCSKALRVLEKKHQSHRAALEKRLVEINLPMGY